MTDKALILEVPEQDDKIGTNQRQKTNILIADDDLTNRLILTSLLKKMGYQVVESVDGLDAIDKFVTEKPDIILMDVMMPNMDGYAATQKIKELCDNQFIPVIFLTAITDDKALAKCIDCGGDDFLSKPYNAILLEAKIDALIRHKELHEQMKIKMHELNLHNNRYLAEHQIASKVFSKIVHSGDLECEEIKHSLNSMSTTTGDVLLAAKSPTGEFYIMVGDFTGHGLSAAIGAIPVSNTFYSMCAKGFHLEDIVSEMNQKLKSAMPTGIFCAAAVISIGVEKNTVSIWNGGLPDIMIYDPATKNVRKFGSKNLPLGILDPHQMSSKVEFIEIEENERIFMFSDGVVEARNANDDLFGFEPFDENFESNQNPNNLFEDILGQLNHFTENVDQTDDITFMEYRCPAYESENISAVEEEQSKQVKTPSVWKTSLYISADVMKSTDPVPLIMSSINEIQGLQNHAQKLFLIISELYLNALDHGILKLDSKIKETDHGFSQYFEQRAKALERLENAWITIDIEHQPLNIGGRLSIAISDSGTGFDFEKLMLKLETNVGNSGRGIELVRSLCARLSFEGTGNKVSADYVWES